jgi:hypothetical protein
MRRIHQLLILFVIIAGSAAPASAAGPELTVVSPVEGAVLEGDSVTVNFTTAGIKLVPTSVPVAEAGKHPEANRPGEGHLHFVLDLQPLVVWERGDPYTFTNVPPGEHQLMVELVQNDHSALSPRVMKQIRFRTSVVPQSMPVTGAGSAFDGAPGLLVVVFLLLSAGFALRRWRV